MTPIYRCKGLIVGALEAVFQPDKMLSGKISQQIKDRFGHAIGPGADAKSRYTVYGKRIVVDLGQVVNGRVGVAVGLKIDQELFGFIAPDHRLFADLNLLFDRHTLCKSAGTGTGSIAVDTAASPQSTVAVGAIESRIHGDLLYSTAEHFAQVGA